MAGVLKANIYAPLQSRQCACEISTACELKRGRQPCGHVLSDLAAPSSTRALSPQGFQTPIGTKLPRNGRGRLLKGEESEVSPTLFRHELIHQEQIDRHGIARFYLIYFRDYLLNLWRLRNHDAAYRNIPFEKEAFERQSEIGKELDDDRRM